MLFVPYSSIIATMFCRMPVRSEAIADRRHHADNDSEHSQKTAKLMTAHAIQRHLQRLAQHSFWAV